MKTQLKSTLCALFLFPVIASADEADPVPMDQWVRSLPLTAPAAAGQYEENGKIKNLTFHYTFTPEGDGTRASEETILNNQVHSSSLYTWEAKAIPGTDKKEYFRRKQADGTDIPKHGGTAYHYLIGNSGTIYKGRPDTVAPASNTFYYTPEFLDGATYGIDGAVSIQSGQADRLAELRTEKFNDWKAGINYEQWLDGERAILRGEGVTNGEPFTKALNSRVEAQKTRLIAPGASAGHLTICFIGRDRSPSPEAFATATRLAAKLLKEHGLTPDAIRTHREVANSGCPGPFVQKWVRDVMAPDKRGPLFGELRKFGVE